MRIERDFTWKSGFELSSVVMTPSLTRNSVLDIARKLKAWKSSGDWEPESSRARICLLSRLNSARCPVSTALGV